MNSADTDCRCAATLPPESSDVAVCDLTLLCAVVSARLELLVGETFLAACRERGAEPTAQVRAGVLECVGALRQLHATLAHEIARRPPLEERAAPEILAMLTREPATLIARLAAVLPARTAS